MGKARTSSKQQSTHVLCGQRIVAEHCVGNRVLQCHLVGCGGGEWWHHTSSDCVTSVTHVLPRVEKQHHHMVMARYKQAQKKRGTPTSQHDEHTCLHV